MVTQVKLHKHKITRRDKPPRNVWKLVWWGHRDGRPFRFTETIGDCRKISKRDAELARAKKEVDIGSGRAQANKPRRLGLKEFLDQDRKAAAIDVKPTTVREMKTAAKHAISALGEDFDVHRLDRAAVQRIKVYLSGKAELASATINKVMRHLQGSFTRGVRLGLFDQNPFDGVTLPKVQPKPVEVFRPEEIDAMLAVCTDVWWEALICLGYTTGLRPGEMLNLLWVDVDLRDHRVTVQAKRAGEFKVKKVTYPILEWSSKTYQDRTVPLPPTTVAVLQRLKAICGRSRYVFLNLTRLKQISEYIEAKTGKLNPSFRPINNLTSAFAEIQTLAAGLLSSDNDHPAEWDRRPLKTLRKSYGTVMARHLPMHDLKRLMGHASIRTTERFYLAAGAGAEKKVAQAFAELGSNRHSTVEDETAA